MKKPALVLEHRAGERTLTKGIHVHSNALTPVPVPGTDRPIMAAEINGTPMVAFRPICESVGVNADSQLQKIKARSWARTAHPAGKGIPESAEVRWERETAEALSVANQYSRLDEWHHDWSARNRWTDWLVPAALVIGLYVLIVAATVAGEIVGGWAA